MLVPKDGLKIAIIGSGFGGLAAAIRLQAAGMRTVLFEAREQAGGRANTFVDQGFTFDTGPTVITAPSCIEELFTLVGRKMSDYLELLPVQPCYRLHWPEGESFDCSLDLNSMKEQIRRRDPRDEEGYVRFLEFSRRNFELGYNALVSKAFLHFYDLLWVIPKLLRLGSHRSFYHTVSRFIHDERLRQAFTFHSVLLGGNPFETSSIYTLFPYLAREGGVFYPRGGMGALVAALVKLYKELGGDLRLSTPVRRLDAMSVEDRMLHHIATDGRSVERFDRTISNADLHFTYAKLLGHDPRVMRMRRRLERMHWSMSSFILCFGTDRKYPGLCQHNIIFGSRYKELLQEIFHGKALPEDLNLYLHAPSVTDPALAPPGCETFYVMSPVPHLGRSSFDWKTIGLEYAEKILAYLERFLPDLRQHIVTRSMMTPYYFRDHLNAYQGNGFSLSPRFTQTAWFRPHHRDSHVPGFYLVGAGTHPGAGVPGVINSAKATVQVMLKDLGKTFRLDRPLTSIK